MTARRRGLERGLAALLLAGGLAFAYIGRAAISSDGAEILSVSMGLFVQGRFEAASLPNEDVMPIPAFRSRYGLFPSVVPVPFLATVWPFRERVGAGGVDAVAALTWSAGALLATLGFLALSRRLAPDRSPLWGPAFLMGTFLWPYAADSFFDPWSAAAIAFGSARLAGNASPRTRDALLAGLLWSVGCWLRPVLWVTAPAPFLAALLSSRKSGDARAALATLGGLAAGLATHLLVNALHAGSALDFGYVLSPTLPFNASFLGGLFGLLASPARGLFLFAPLALAALVAARRLSPSRIVLFGVAPAILALVISRWFVWSGGSCWGPRYLVGVLPLLLAPAVLAPARLASGLAILGFLVNLPGVVVAPGAWMGYAATLEPPPGIRWPEGGPARIDTVARLSPLLGHPWLMARAAGREWPSPGVAAGARETRRPAPGEFLSPRVVRAAAGLPPVSPVSAKLLTRIAAAYALRGRADSSVLFAKEALRLEPANPDAALILREGGHLRTP